MKVSVPRVNRSRLFHDAQELATGMAEVIVSNAMARFDKLTDKEVDKFSGDRGLDSHYYLARVLCLSVVEDGQLYREYASDSMIKGRLVKKVCSIMRKRP